LRYRKDLLVAAVAGLELAVFYVQHSGLALIAD
jgi:hypothetical protein